MKPTLICFAFVASLSVAVAQTQTTPPAPKQESAAVSQQKGDSELGLFAGAVIPPGGGSTAVGGGANYAYALNTWLYPYAEFSVLPNALNQSVPAGNVSFQTTGNLVDYHAGVHIRIPVNKRFVPYGVFAVGAFKPYGVSVNTVSGGSVILSQKESLGAEFAFNYGGGIRYYLTNLIGVRAEVKAYGPTSKFGGTPVRVMFGIFFQFKKKNI